MKKNLLIALLSIICCSFCFSKTFGNSEQMVDDFLQVGQYIKIIKDEDNIYYISKNCITSLSIDENDIEIATNDFDIWSGRDNESFCFNINKYKIESDDNGNIIIEKR